MFYHILLLLLVCLPFGAHAETTFGPEFEFTSQRIERAWDKKEGAASAKVGQEELQAAKRLLLTVTSLCLKSNECHSEKGEDAKKGVRIVFHDGWWFQISVDPGCVEVQAKPSTIAEMQKNRQRMDDYIFQAAYQSGLFIDEAQGAGHLNIGFFSMFGRPELNHRIDVVRHLSSEIGRQFLNFYIDFHNHLELASGALGRRDNINARAFDLLKDEFKSNILKKIIILSEGKYASEYFEILNFLAYNIQRSMPGKSSGEALHYQSINIEHLLSANGLASLSNADYRLEIRSLYSQESAEKFILEAQLFQMRNDFLKTQAGFVPLIALDKKKYSDQELVSRFYVYVTEAGGDFKQYRSLLPTHLKKVSPDSFVLGDRELDLNSYQDFKILKSHILFIASSKWIQKRFSSYLLNPKNYSKKYFLDLFNSILDCAQRQIQMGEFNFSNLYLEKFDEYLKQFKSTFTTQNREQFTFLNKLEERAQNLQKGPACYSLFGI